LRASKLIELRDSCSEAGRFLILGRSETLRPVVLRVEEYPSQKGFLSAVPDKISGTTAKNTHDIFRKKIS
jgi:hypothetical protein